MIIVAAVGLAALVQIVTDPRIGAAFISKSLLALGVYAVHASIGAAALILTAPRLAFPVGLAVAFFGWIGLGMLGLIRLAPRLREPPSFLLRFGIADVICLVLIGGGLAAAARLV